MFQNNISNPFTLAEVSDIQFLGTHTIQYYLRFYRIQFVTICAQLQKNKRFTLAHIVSLLEQQTILYNRIRVLRQCVCNAKCKPPLSFCRDYDWFMIGEPVVCFAKNGEHIFVGGKVYNNKSSLYDGRLAVSVVYDKCVSHKHFLSGYGEIYTVTSPFVLKAWEFKYLQNHLEFAHMWIRRCVQTRYSLGEAMRFLQAL